MFVLCSRPGWNQPGEHLVDVIILLRNMSKMQAKLPVTDLSSHLQGV
jgi:hypothetical protein